MVLYKHYNYIIMKRRLFISALVALSICSCTRSDHKRTESLQAGIGNSAYAKSLVDYVSDEVHNNWKYTTKVNELDDSETYLAQIVSSQPLDFSFARTQKAHATLTVRKNNSGTRVMLSISKGIFASVYNDKNGLVTVRFDDDKAESYSVSESADHKLNIVFIDNSEKFITRLKTAKKLIIQSEFYKEGFKNIKFETAGFAWEK